MLNMIRMFRRSQRRSLFPSQAALPTLLEAYRIVFPPLNKLESVGRA
jgi:hypothetical protein